MVPVRSAQGPFPSPQNFSPLHAHIPLLFVPVPRRCAVPRGAPISWPAAGCPVTPAPGCGDRALLAPAGRGAHPVLGAKPSSEEALSQRVGALNTPHR